MLLREAYSIPTCRYKVSEMITEVVNQLERILEYVENLEKRIVILEEECLSEDRFATVNGGERQLRDIKKRLDNKYVPTKGTSNLKLGSDL